MLRLVQVGAGEWQQANEQLLAAIRAELARLQGGVVTPSAMEPGEQPGWSRRLPKYRLQ